MPVLLFVTLVSASGRGVLDDGLGAGEVEQDFLVCGMIGLKRAQMERQYYRVWKEEDGDILPKSPPSFVVGTVTVWMDSYLAC